MTGPALLKTILQFFSSSEAGLTADPTACEMAPGVDLWWGPESKRPRNHPGNKDPQAPSDCDGGRSSYPPQHAPRLGTARASGVVVAWGTHLPHCSPLLGARWRVPLEPLSREPHAWHTALPTSAWVGSFCPSGTHALMSACSHPAFSTVPHRGPSHAGARSGGRLQ